MSSSSLFHIDRDGSLSPMAPQPYENEDHIQRLLAQHPEILSSNYNGVAPRRWALIQREVPVPDGVADNRWSLDHLFVDQDAIPTLIEVKRGRDTRSRREVVGQMFDYAANGPTYWPISDLREAFAKTNQHIGTDSDEALSILLGEDKSSEEFWSNVEENLRSGRVRLIFLVDEMPPELLRIVEFLAQQLRTAEVYAVEIRQHTGMSGQILSTNVLGQMQNNEQKIQIGRSKSPISIDEWFSHYREKFGAEATDIARDIYDWCSEHGLIGFVTSAQTPSLGFYVYEGQVKRYPFSLSVHGKAVLPLGYLAYSPKFADASSRQSIADELISIGLKFQLKSLAGTISTPILELQETEVRQRYLQEVERIVNTIKNG